MDFTIQFVLECNMFLIIISCWNFVGISVLFDTTKKIFKVGIFDSCVVIDRKNSAVVRFIGSDSLFSD